MAEYSAIAASFTLISTAIESTKTLYDTASSYKSRDKAHRRLQDGLQNLAKSLDALKQVFNTVPSNLELLRGPVDRYSKFYHNFKQSLENTKPSTPRNIEDCLGCDSLTLSTTITAEKTYYHYSSLFIKQGLQPSE